MQTRVRRGRAAELGHENSYDAVIPKCRQAVPVTEYLAQTEPELMFLVLGGGALDFRHEYGPVLLPRQVKVRPGRQAAAWFDSALLRTFASSFWVSVCPRRPQATTTLASPGRSPPRPRPGMRIREMLLRTNLLGIRLCVGEHDLSG